MKKLLASYVVGLVLCMIANPVFSQDIDNDAILDVDDNCLQTPNGPDGGSCTSGTIGELCMSDADCGDNGFCSINQEDTFPPEGNDIGDACDCESDFGCDGDVDAQDVTAFLTDFGRGQYFNPCESGTPCNGDFLCDGDVDATDVTTFLADFGRGQYFNPCPACVVGEWCTYPTIVEIDVENFRFDADSNDSTQIDTVTINVGDTVRWTWRVGFHTVTSGVDLADPNAGVLFDEPSDNSNQSFSFTFTQVGTFPYFCRFHVTVQNMKGIIEVQ